MTEWAWCQISDKNNLKINLTSFKNYVLDIGDDQPYRRYVKMRYDFNDSLIACENVLKYNYSKDWNDQPTSTAYKKETLAYCQDRIDDVEEQFKSKWFLSLDDEDKADYDDYKVRLNSIKETVTKFTNDLKEEV